MVVDGLLNDKHSQARILMCHEIIHYIRGPQFIPQH